MVELRPIPFAVLVRRLVSELDGDGPIFHLPRRRVFAGDGERDLSVRFHGRPAGTPLGPAAGPHSQLAQNLVLAWLAGCRILELKTVQVKDALDIPRPCIDMATVGYNVEWSQELSLPQSLEEYVKASMLVDIVRASGRLPLAEREAATIWDMSVGYDLAGIRSPGVTAFLAGMRDASAVVDRLRAEIPREHARLRDVDFRTRLSDTLTLSTFHGCPPGEIESILEHLLDDHGLHVVVKLNPMLLGPDALRSLLHDRLGYDDVVVPDSAFERDARWEQAAGFIERLAARAASAGLGFGVKLTNTLIVENRRGYLPASEAEAYLSGPPLHVLAMHLVRRVRRTFGASVPISFSAGVSRHNVASTVALGLVPVTICSDLLAPGGYGRVQGYLDALRRRMDDVGARSIDELVIRDGGHGEAALDQVLADAGGPDGTALATALADGHDLAAACRRVRTSGGGPDGGALLRRWRDACAVRATEDVVAALADDPFYARPRNARPPRKIGSRLDLLDCITCDKCVPVCPNDANFTLPVPVVDEPARVARLVGGRWIVRTRGRLVTERRHQIAHFADACNECGNCDVFCPEDGGPHLVKPRFFGSLDDWRAFAPRDGLHVAADASGTEVHVRLGGRPFRLATRDGRTTFEGEGFAVSFDEADPEHTLDGEADGEIDLSSARLVALLRDALLEGDAREWPAWMAGPGRG